MIFTSTSTFVINSVYPLFTKEFYADHYYAICLFMPPTAVDKSHLRPVIPPLTRYEESIIPMVKKKQVECDVMAPDMRKKLDRLTISKLCTRLNTLQVYHLLWLIHL